MWLLWLIAIGVPVAGTVGFYFLPVSRYTYIVLIGVSAAVAGFLVELVGGNVTAYRMGVIELGAGAICAVTAMFFKFRAVIRNDGNA